MKKISNISVSSKDVLSNKYFKAVIIILLIVMIIMSAVLIKVYIDVNKKNAENNNSAKNIITQMEKNIDEYTIFEDENGFLGVSDKNERVIIEPYWDDIYILSEDRFIVGREFNDVKKMSIIDNESNILVPFTFETFRSFSSEFVGGFTGNDNDFFLFDKKGELLADNIWTGYKYSDGMMYLNDSEDEYRCKFADDAFQFVYVNFCRSPGNVPFNIILTDPDKIRKIGTDDLKRIADITEGYLDFLISGNSSSDIADLTSEQYYSALSSNDFFKECNVKKISDCSLDFSEEKSGTSFNVKLVVNYDYKKKKLDLKNISSEIIFNIVRDENNRLVLKSINKTEL